VEAVNVLVVPEDFRKDQFILKPIVRALLAEVGCAKAKVEVCKDPLIGGITEALKWQVIEPILARYRWYVDLFLLCVDRDCSEGRVGALRGLEEKAQAMLGTGRFFLAENAWQELEVWILAGHDKLPKDWKWNEICAERDPKERYYLPFAKLSGCMDHPAEGRGTLANEAARTYKRIRKLVRRTFAILRIGLQQHSALSNALDERQVALLLGLQIIEDEAGKIRDEDETRDSSQRCSRMMSSI